MSRKQREGRYAGKCKGKHYRVINIYGSGHFLTSAKPPRALIAYLFSS